MAGIISLVILAIFSGSMLSFYFVRTLGLLVWHLTCGHKLQARRERNSPVQEPVRRFMGCTYFNTLVRISDMDVYGVVNNSKYLQISELARTDFVMKEWRLRVLSTPPKKEEGRVSFSVRGAVKMFIDWWRKPTRGDMIMPFFAGSLSRFRRPLRAFDVAQVETRFLYIDPDDVADAENASKGYLYAHQIIRRRTPADWFASLVRRRMGHDDGPAGDVACILLHRMVFKQGGRVVHGKKLVDVLSPCPITAAEFNALATELHVHDELGPCAAPEGAHPAVAAFDLADRESARL